MSNMRIAVTGTKGQVVRSLIERASGTDIEVVALGRPALDLSDPRTVDSAIHAGIADVLVSAAAYTDVNGAEAEPDLADLVNGRAPGALAERARSVGIPIIHLSTDYVFDGEKPCPYRETDPIRPLSAYGRSKAKGERAVAAVHPRHVILRTCWVYSPFNRNFVRTILELARRQPELRVVADQVGNPTAAGDVAVGILAVARHLVDGQGEDRYGTFHMASNGAASWAEFATAILARSAARGGPFARVVPISSAEHSSPAQRPQNSRLDCARIAKVHGIRLPDWRVSLDPCVDRILEQAA